MLQFPFDEHIPHEKVWNTGILRHPSRRKWIVAEDKCQRKALIKLRNKVERKLLCNADVDRLGSYLFIGQAEYPLIMEIGEDKVRIGVSI
jgi:hypothetical protein